MTSHADAGTYRWINVTEEAAFPARDGSGALVFQDKLWLIGGWNPRNKDYYPLDCVNDVWNSGDGAAWARVKPNTYGTPSFDPVRDWEGRHTAGYAVFKGKMWLLGGDPIQGHFQPDIWSSTDGVHWDCVCRDAPWGQRVLFHTVVHAGKIWVMGGQTLPPFAPGDETVYNDVWCSEDGAHWERVLHNAPWAPRGLIGGSAVMDGRIWLIGGGLYKTPTRPYSGNGEVWSSADGLTWDLCTKEVPWKPRVYHDVAVFDGKLWLMEGQRIPDGNGNDVWFSTDGRTWQELAGTPWPRRHAASVFVFRDALWMMCGCHLQRDIWKLVKTEDTGP